MSSVTPKQHHDTFLIDGFVLNAVFVDKNQARAIETVTICKKNKNTNSLCFVLELYYLSNTAAHLF